MNKFSRNSLLLTLAGVLVLGLAFLVPDDRELRPVSPFEVVAMIAIVMLFLGLLGLLAEYVTRCENKSRHATPKT